MQTLYIAFNNSAPNEIKFGIYNNNKYEIITDHYEEFSHCSRYLNLFDIEFTSKYDVILKNVDKIISIIGRKIFLIESFENKLNTKLKYLRELNKGLLNTDGVVKEFIDVKFKDSLYNFIIKELELFGVIVKPYTKEQVEEINEKCKKIIQTKREKDLELPEHLKDILKKK
jgi:hypothetical protein